MALPPLDFPASPTVGQLYPDPPVTGQPTYRWDGAQWLAYAAAKPPTPTKPDNFAKKNYIINGAMQVSQENGTTAVGNGGYPADTFPVLLGGSSGVFSSAQVASATAGGSPNRIRVTVTTADAAVGASDIVYIAHRVEGLRAADLRFGSASAKTVTLQFGCKGPAGNYCTTLINSAANRSYVAEYVIAAGEANTDVVKSVTIAGDTTGTWLADNGIGIEIRWGLMAGTTFQQAAGAWGGVNAAGSANQFNFLGTNGNVFELFDVSLTEGSVAPPFQVPDYASELELCERYFLMPNTGGGYGHIGWFPSSTIARTSIPFRTTMRASPTLIVKTIANVGINWLSGNHSASAAVIGTVGPGGCSVDFTFPATFTGGQSGTVGMPYPSIFFSARL